MRLVLPIYLSLLRPEQYVKNLFIFLPLFFALRIRDVERLLPLCFVFITFSLLASAVYIINDIFDRDRDRHHKQKKRRPIASGLVSLRIALLIMLALLTLSFSLTWLIVPDVVPLYALYLGINVWYSIQLKHIAIIDTFVIASGFVIRIFLGGIVANLTLSMWIVLLTFLLALFIAFAKRRDDVLILLRTKQKMRRALYGYNLDFLNASLVILASMTLVAYIMYTVNASSHVNGQNLYISSVFVLLGILRYLQLTLVFHRSGSPTDVLVKDRFIQLSLLAWMLSLYFILYW